MPPSPVSFRAASKNQRSFSMEVFPVARSGIWWMMSRMVEVEETALMPKWRAGPERVPKARMSPSRRGARSLMSFPLR